MGDPVTNFEVNSADPAKARRFYTAVLGWKMNEVPNNYTFVDTDAGGKGIGGGRFGSAHYWLLPAAQR